MVRKLHRFLNQTLSERTAPDDRTTVIILDGTCEDLGSRGRALIHQHHQGNLLVRAAPVGPIVLTRITATFSIDNEVVLVQQLVGYFNSSMQIAATVLLQVEYEIVHALRLQLLEALEKLLMGGGGQNIVPIQYDDEGTLFSDLDYLKSALDVFTDTEEVKYAPLTNANGIEIKLTDAIKKKISRLIPPEAMPANDYLRLSTDKTYCMNAMKKSMQNSITESAWPDTHYLWRLNPVFDWIEDKAGVFYRRNEVPVLGVTGSMTDGDVIFITAGLIPNRRSTPVVDEWFGVSYKQGSFEKILTMDEVMQRTHLHDMSMPNTGKITEGKVSEASGYLSLKS